MQVPGRHWEPWWVVAGGSGSGLFKPMRLKQDSFLLQRKLQAEFISYYPSYRRENCIPG